MTPRATYRIQFKKDFPFGRAEEIVPYLDGLGISHIYASPITTARSGSQHGYDVVDPTRVNPELGGEEGLRSLVRTLRRHRMGLIIDIVPNHMGVAGGENGWWNDVLRHGCDSEFARFFDIDWKEKLLLPILGAPLGQVLSDGQVQLDTGGEEPMVSVYGEHRLPIRPEDQEYIPSSKDSAALADLLARQHYRLGWWRSANDELNWRRFFTINELAGLRVEDPQVFEKTHELYFRLFKNGLVDGFRVDHVDGLSDPATYCRTLRSRLDQIERRPDAPLSRAYLVVEKILGPGEQLPIDWQVDGTSGYDFMEEVAALLHDPAGGAPLAALWQDFARRDLTFSEEELRARRQMLSWAFEGQLDACVRSFHALAQSDRQTQGLTRGMLRRAIERMLWVFPVYRTYGTGEAAPGSDARVREVVRRDAARFSPPGEEDVVDTVLGWLAADRPGDPDLAAEAVRRFQQLSAPIAAKAVEDTAFYRYGVLLSRTDVGFDASRFSLEPSDFHSICERRARDYPIAMLATATHDHKRGEDVRARIAVLSAIPAEWDARVRKWDGMSTAAEGASVDPADRYMLHQTVYGAWPPGLDAQDTEGLRRYADRLAAWQEKALREAKLRSSWEEPDVAYEQQCRAYALALLDPAHSAEYLRDVRDFLDRTASATMANILVQTALRLTVPGVPDTYQGSELGDFSLVDPDNRRPVDFPFARRALEQGTGPDGKLLLTRDLLRLRRNHPDLFARGAYVRASTAGARAANVLAFNRSLGDTVLDCAVILNCGSALFGNSSPSPDVEWWEDTVVAFADGGSTDAAQLFAKGPVHVALRTLETN